MTERRRVVITGIGLVTPFGEGIEAAWAALREGRSGVRRITRFDASGLPTRIAATVPEETWSALASRAPDWVDRGRVALLAVSAADAAVADAGEACLGGGDRAGVVAATGTGVYEHEEIFGLCANTRASRDAPMDWEAVAARRPRVVKPRLAERQSPGSVSASLARRFQAEGPVLSVMTACAGGTHAIGDAARWIRMGRADVVVAGGADTEVTPMGVASFALLGALSRCADPVRASRPFDAARDGFVLGEGAAMLVLEERSRALARGARIYAEVAGFGAACDAFRATDPHPDGRGATAAMTRALADARVPREAVGYINAHGTSTIANDRAETLAIRRCFGAHADRLAVSSTKSMVGHALVAAGAIEAAFTALALARQWVPPTVNLDTPDPACDLDYVPNAGRSLALDLALSNSFAFGGQTACLALARADQA